MDAHYFLLVAAGNVGFWIDAFDDKLARLAWFADEVKVLRRLENREGFTATFESKCHH